MTQAQLECRDFGHMWSNQNTNVKQDSYSKLFHEIMLCPRCHTTKHRVINMRGELIDTSYRYPEGYLIPHFGRMPKDVRADMRLALVKILLEK